MDFVLGIFTGFFTAYSWGYYLVKQKEREQARKRAEQLKELKTLWKDIRITPEDMEYLMSKPAPFPLCPAHEKDIKQQLQDAIDREDFKEAARLRDLMNKA